MADEVSAMTSPLLIKLDKLRRDLAEIDAYLDHYAGEPLIEALRRIRGAQEAKK